MIVTARSISKSISVVSSVALVALGIVGVSYAAPVSVEASKDSYVRSSAFDDKNYGADSNLQVKFAATNANSVSNNRKSWIGFDVSSVNPATILSANLALTVGDPIGASNNNLPYTFHVYGLLDGTRDNWVEGTGTTAAATTPANSSFGITWLNAPGNNGASSSGVDPLDTVDLGTFTFNGRGGAPGTVINFTSAALVSLINADTNGTVSIVLTRDTPEGAGNEDSVVQTFASRTHASFAGPTLTMDTDAVVVPEAGALTLALPALGLLGLVGLRKSRKA